MQSIFFLFTICADYKLEINFPGYQIFIAKLTDLEPPSFSLKEKTLTLNKYEEFKGVIWAKGGTVAAVKGVESLQNV